MPDELMRHNNMAQRVAPLVLPEVDKAVHEMESLGSHLTQFSAFGKDPLLGHQMLIDQRETMFNEKYPDFQHFFHHVVNQNFRPFQEALMFYIDTTRNLHSSAQNSS